MTKDEPIDLGTVRGAREELSKLVKAHPEICKPEAQRRLTELLDDENALDAHERRAELSTLFDKLRALDSHGGLDPLLSDDDRIDFAIILNALVSAPQKEHRDGENEESDD